MKVQKTIEVRLIKKRYARPIDLVQYDTGIQLVFLVEDFTVPTGTTATLYVQKPSGKFVYQKTGITISGNTITVDLHNQALTEHGDVGYQVQLKNDTDLITTFTGTMQVEKSLADAGATESKTVISAFEDLTAEKIAEIEAATQEFINVAEHQLVHKAPAIIGEGIGAMVTVNDASDSYVHGLKLYGRTVQDGTPTPEVPVPLTSAGDGGTVAVTVCGKNLIDINALRNSGSEHTVDGNVLHVTSASAGTWRGVNAAVMHFMAGQTYTFSVMVDNITSGVATIGFRRKGTNAFIRRSAASGVGALIVTYTPTEDVVAYASLLCTDGTAADGDVTYSNVMLEVGNGAGAYESYQDGGSVAASTPNGLPGIPVSSGGNYTDGTGQQWICDEVDFARGAYVQRVGTRNSADMSSAGWTASSIVNPNGTVYLRNFQSALPVGGLWTTRKCADKPTQMGLHDFAVQSNASGLTVLYVVSNAASAAEFGEAVIAEGSTIMYALATPVETELSAEEIAAFETLHTIKPNTTVFNDGGGGMMVEYDADTKTYIDRKFAELATAIISNV